MSFLFTIITQWYHHSPGLEDVMVSSLPAPFRLTRHRDQLDFQSVSHLDLSIPNATGQLEALSMAPQSWLGEELTNWYPSFRLSLGHCPSPWCQSGFPRTQLELAHTRHVDFRFFTVITESSLYSFPFSCCSQLTCWVLSCGSLPCWLMWMQEIQLPSGCQRGTREWCLYHSRSPVHACSTGKVRQI